MDNFSDPPLTLAGPVDNTGTLALSTAGAETALLIGDDAMTTATLQGGGRVLMVGANGASIAEGVAGAKLTNADNTIFGAGTIGAGALILDNGGLIAASGAGQLQLDLSSATASLNTGWLGATAGGELDLIGGALTNSGSLIANAAAIEVDASARVSNTSAVAARNGGSIDFAAGTLANISGGVLTGAAWTAGAASDSTTSTLSFADAFTTLKASLSLFGEGEVIDGGATLESQLTSIVSGGHLTLGRDCAINDAIGISGELTLLEGAVFSSGLLNLTGTVDGQGTIASSLNVGPQGFSVGPGEVTFTGAATIAGVVGGKGTAAFSGATTTLNNGGAFTALVDFNDETVNFNTAISIGVRGLAATNSTLKISAAGLEIDGAATFSGGSVGGPGALNVLGAATFQSGATLSVLTLETVNLALYREGPASSGKMIVLENLSYTGIFEQDSGTKLVIGAGDVFTLEAFTRTDLLEGVTSGAGTLAMEYGVFGVATTEISVATWEVVSAVVTVGPLTYSGAFSATSGTQISLTTHGSLVLDGSANLNDATLNGIGSKYLILNGTATIGEFSIATTTGLMANGVVTQSAGAVEVGGSVATDKATLVVGAKGTWNIADNSGVTLGTDSASRLVNYGLFEKTGGAGVSAIAPVVLNSGHIVSASTGGALDIKSGVLGDGSVTIAGSSTWNFGNPPASTTVEFDAAVAATQTVDFSGDSARLVLDAPLGFKAEISGFDSGGNFTDSIQLSGDWTLGGHAYSAGGGFALTLTSGAQTTTLDFASGYQPDDFHTANANGATTLTYI